ADDFMKRMSAWTEPSLTDWTIAFVPFRLKAGSISKQEYDRARSEWIEKLRSLWKAAGRRRDTERDWMIWSNAYAGPVATEADAKEALATVPSVMPPVMNTGRWTTVDLNAGKTFVLGGEAERALVPLRRVSSSCGMLADPTMAGLAQLYLG